MSAAPTRTAADVGRRDCGECAACCDLPGVPSLGKAPCTPCQHPSAAGCEVHAARPQECREYRCLWLDDALGDDAARPDRLGLMFDLPSLVQDHPDYAGVQVICAREVRHGARDEPRGAALLTRLARAMVVRLTARGGATQLCGPRPMVELLAARAAARARATTATTTHAGLRVGEGG